MLALISCDTTKRAVRHINKAKVLAPELFIDYKDTLRDTVFMPLEAISDTFVVTEYDTIKIDKERLRIEIIKQKDTLYVEGQCKEDTLYLERIVEVPIIQEAPQEPKGKNKEKTFWDYLYGALYILLAIVGIKFISDLFKK